MQLHCEEAAEPAAGLGIGQQAAPARGRDVEQRQRLVGHPETTQPVTGGVIGDLRVRTGAEIGPAHDVDDERGELVRAARQRRRPDRIDRIVLQQMRRLVDHHVPARSRRHHDRHVVIAEDVDQVAGHRARVVPRPRVEGRLAAAGLAFRHLHREAQPLEQGDGGEADVGPHGVDQAGDEQFDAGRPLRRGR